MKLVLSGGGIKVVSVAGALEKLSSTYKFDHIIGTSAGAILAVIYCFEIKISSIIHIFKEIKLPDLNDISLHNLVNNYALIKNPELYNTLENIFEKCNISKNITFLELYDLTKKQLDITSFNMHKCKTVIFNYQNYPNLKIIDALNMSCNLPLLFSPIEFEDDFYVDGGILDNYPLTYFPYNDPSVIGIRTLSTEKFELDCFEDYLHCIFKTLVSANDSLQSNHNKNQSIDIIVNNVSVIDFGINYDEILELFQLGINAAEQFLIEKKQIFYNNNDGLQLKLNYTKI